MEPLFSEVVLSLAKMELDNFFKSVMPVADYFDQSDMLVAVSSIKPSREPADDKSFHRLTASVPHPKCIKTFVPPFSTFYKRKKTKKPC